MSNAPTKPYRLPSAPKPAPTEQQGAKPPSPPRPKLPDNHPVRWPPKRPNAK